MVLQVAPAFHSHYVLSKRRQNGRYQSCACALRRYITAHQYRPSKHFAMPLDSVVSLEISGHLSCLHVSSNPDSSAGFEWKTCCPSLWDVGKSGDHPGIKSSAARFCKWVSGILGGSIRTLLILDILAWRCAHAFKHVHTRAADSMRVHTDVCA